jgi:hypothetical protein
VLGKGHKRVIWCKKCIHMYVNAKIKPVKTTSGIGAGGVGDEEW